MPSRQPKQAGSAPSPRDDKRILAVKLGLNPNSSSLGVDVTFLLFGAALLSFATPIVAALLRLGRNQQVGAERRAADDDDTSVPE